MTASVQERASDDRAAAASDPRVSQAIATFWGRIANALLGCTTGLLFLLIGGSREWNLPLAWSVTVLITSYLVRVPVMPRQVPITAAFVIACGLHLSRMTGAEAGWKRVAEVMLGCVVGPAVTWLIAKVWPPPEAPKGAVTTKT